MKRLNKILVPIDFSKACKCALEAALSFKAKFGGEITALHVVEPLRLAALFSGLDVPEYTERASKIAENRLDEFLKDALGKNRDQVSVVVTSARRISTEILIQSGDRPDNLIVMGTAGRTGLHKFLLGSVAEEVVLRSTCPVLTVHESCAREGPLPEPDACMPIKRILVPTDFSPIARAGVELAAGFAVAFNAELHVQTCLDDRTKEALEPLFEHKADLDHIFEQATAQAKSQVETEARGAMAAEFGEVGSAVSPKIIPKTSHGHPAKAIVDYAEEIKPDLIVMGSKGRASHTKNIFGSISAYVVRVWEGPVLTVRISDEDAD